jgi:hypothetical protein
MAGTESLVTSPLLQLYHRFSARCRLARAEKKKAG